MKKINVILAALCALFLLVSCSGKGGVESGSTAAHENSASLENVVSAADDKAAVTESSEGAGTADEVEIGTDVSSDETSAETDGTLSVMRQIADSVRDSGLFGSSMELFVKGDDFADDLLEYTYGVEDPDGVHIADYILSDQTSKEAYSFAFIVFGDDFTIDDFKAVSTAFEDVYIDDLASALEVYNPEAYAMCKNALIEGWNLVLDGKNTIHCAYLIISEDNAAAAQSVADAATNAFRSE